MNLLHKFREEKSGELKGGIYHQTQIKLAYNTNRIEGSKLSEDQTRYIYETNTIFTEDGETTVNTDDIIETDTCRSAQDQYRKLVKYFFPYYPDSW